VLVKTNSRFSCRACYIEIILWPAENGKSTLIVLEISFRSSGELHLYLHLATLLDSSSFRSDCNVFVSLSFPKEVEVELPIVSKHNLLRLYLVDEKLTEVQFEWFVLLNFSERFISHYGVVNLIALSL
jgi:hypothetical protein